MKKLSPSQQIVVDALTNDETAYVYSTEYWNHQTLVTKNGNTRKDFNRRTREVLVDRGILVLKEGTTNNYILKKPV